MGRADMSGILVCKNDDEPIVFPNMGEFFAWLVTVAKDLEDVRDFLSGGVLIDSDEEMFCLMDLPS